MIITDLRLGHKQIVSIYRNGKIIWEGGKQCTMGQLIAALSGYAMAESFYPVSTQMAASASAEGTAKPNASNVLSGMKADGALSAVAMPHKADTLNRAGRAAMTLGMCATPTAGSIVYRQGQTGGVLAMSGRPQLANTLERAGATAADITTHATPAAQGVTNTLALAKGKSIGTMFYETVGAVQTSGGAFGNLSIAAQPKIQTVCDVSFVVNGEVVYQTQLLDGETCKDPVETGRIEVPTKESTAQYHYDYAGWSLTDGGDAIDGGTVDVELLKEQYIGFGYNSEVGLIMGAITPPPFLLTVDLRYKVVWDGVAYEVQALDTSSLIPGTVGMGNGARFGFPGNNEPFIILCSATDLVFISLVDTAANEHPVAIYRIDPVSGVERTPITADTVFYAAFDATVRTYQVNFYDDDGTLLETQEVAYGDTPDYTPPEREKFIFDGWQPDISAVTGDAEYHAKWTEITEIILYSGTCGSDASWTINDAGVLRIFGTGAMTQFSNYSSVPWYAHRSLVTSVVVEEGITSIGCYSFWECVNMVEVTFPETLTLISYDTFQTCTSLTGVIIPDSVTMVAARAFCGCTALATVTLGKNLKTIGQSAFDSCAFTSITIPASVTTINSFAFQKSKLTSAIFENRTGWYVTMTYNGTSGTNLASANLANASTAATYLKTTYYLYYWYRK